MLEDAIGAEHVRRAHAAQAAVMAMLRRARRIVGRQMVERRRHTGSIEEVPERLASTAQPRRRWLVIDRPEIELELVVAHFPAAFAGDDLAGGVDRQTLAL